MKCVRNFTRGQLTSRMHLILCFAIAACMLCGLTPTSQADPIFINNHSFEMADLSDPVWSNLIDVETGNPNDPDYWVEDGLNDGGAFAERIVGFASEGANHLGISGGPVTQTLAGVSLLPNMRYTLTVGVGNRSGFTDAANQSVFGLDAGGVSLGRTNFNASALSPASFNDQTFTFFTDGSPLAGDLTIVLGNGGPNRSHYDNIRLDVSDASTTPFGIIINRDTGNITIDNNSGAGVSFAGLSVLSPGGALNPGDWNSISGNYDSSGNSSVSSDEWLVFEASVNELSEGTLGTGSIADGTTVNLGDNVWQRYYDEGVTFEYLDASSGNTVAAAVTFVGNGGVGWDQGDIDFDGDIDGQDWPIVRDNFNTVFPEDTTLAEAYSMGDLDGNLAVDRADIFLFKDLFEAANPGVAFSSITVPEPTTLMLVGLAVGGVLAGRRRGLTVVALLVVIGLVGNADSAMADPISVFNHSFENADFTTGNTWSNLIDVEDTSTSDPDVWVDEPLNDGNAFSELIAGFASEGTNHLGIGNGSTVTQTLTGVTLQPNSLYALTVGVGNRDGQTGGGNQSVFGLNAGASPLGNAVFDASTVPVGTFADASFFYQTTGTVTPGDLQISLGVDSGDRAHFDNVRLDVFDLDDGIPALDVLVLEVSNSGATLSNTSGNGVSQEIDYYEITSASGVLNSTNWTSFQDTNFQGDGGSGSGDGWEELGSPSGNVDTLAEHFLTGSTVIAPGASTGLGNIFAGATDLTLSYRTADGAIQNGLVIYDLSSPYSADLNLDGDVDGSDFLQGQRLGLGASFFADFAAQYGSGVGGGAAAVTVPEPTGIILGGLAMTCLALGRVWRDRRSLMNSLKYVRAALVLGVCLAMSSQALADRTADRIYTFGDDPLEDASAGTLVGSGSQNVNAGWTLDTMGPDGAYIDLQVNISTDPMYVSVADRPGAGAGDLGIEFDGDDHLETFRLGLPSTSINDTSQGGPLDYTGVAARGFQLWVKPANNTTQQTIVSDTNQFGVEISDTGFWVQQFNGGNNVSDFAVEVGQWTHIMVVSPVSDGSIMYVNGIAAAVSGGGFNNTDMALNVGAEAGATEGFVGVLDDLEMFVLGEPPFSTQSWGAFDYISDNEFVAGSNLTPGDVDGDNDVDDDDVADFIANWKVEQRVDGFLIGDLNSRQNGDLNFDGITNFKDWAILRANYTGGTALDLGALLASATVPEPTGMVLLVTGVLAAFGSRRK